MTQLGILTMRIFIIKNDAYCFSDLYLDLMLHSDIMYFANKSAKEQTIRIQKDPKKHPIRNRDFDVVFG